MPARKSRRRSTEQQSPAPCHYDANDLGRAAEPIPVSELERDMRPRFLPGAAGARSGVGNTASRGGDSPSPVLLDASLGTCTGLHLSHVAMMRQQRCDRFTRLPRPMRSHRDALACARAVGRPCWVWARVRCGGPRGNRAGVLWRWAWADAAGRPAALRGHGVRGAAPRRQAVRQPPATQHSIPGSPAPTLVRR